ncbi:MAG: hypothetical protein WCO35_01230 [Candidatus Nomurabacteria bacterium]
MGKDFKFTDENLKTFSIKEFGESSVSELKGELALLIREKFSNEELEEMGLAYIAVLHKPIISFSVDNSAGTLRSGQNIGYSLIDSYYDIRYDDWVIDRGSFAFLVN